jgi:MraZ protein
MFRGRHNHTLDSKGRLSIPAGFRMEIHRRSEMAPVLTLDKECLALYPQEDWNAFERELTETSRMKPEVQAIARLFMANAEDAPIDSQGRILIPKHLRDHAALTREVTVSGNGKRIEIWDTQRLADELRRTVERLDEYRDVFASFER